MSSLFIPIFPFALSLHTVHWWHLSALLLKPSLQTECEQQDFQYNVIFPEMHCYIVIICLLKTNDCTFLHLCHRLCFELCEERGHSQTDTITQSLRRILLIKQIGGRLRSPGIRGHSCHSDTIIFRFVRLGILSLALRD